MELIGREAELREVVDRLADRRLVTLIGPAGIGKTALAFAVSAQLAPRYELGAHVVDLTRVDEPDAVGGSHRRPARVLLVRGLARLPVGDTGACRRRQLRARHVRGGRRHRRHCSAACRTPTVLATSRSPLDLPAESLVVLGPSACPERTPPTWTTTPCACSSSGPAMPARRSRDDQLAAVAVLCRQLDGVPLALELAAARTRTMQPAEILARLGEGVDVLARPRFRGDQRHRSLVGDDRVVVPAPARRRRRPVRSARACSPARSRADMVAAVGADVGLDADGGGRRPPVAGRLFAGRPPRPAPAPPRSGCSRPCGRSPSIGCEEQGILDEARGRLADHVVGGGRRDHRRGRATLGHRRSSAACWSMYDNIVASLRWCLAHDADGTRPLLLLCRALGRRAPGPHRRDRRALRADASHAGPTPRARSPPTPWPPRRRRACLIGDPGGAYALAERDARRGRARSAPRR